MISYSQNFEDVILWRALKDVPFGQYIDIGGQHPVIDSVSKTFYDHGWRGIHVEPVPEYAQKLRIARPEETVLEVAIDKQDGSIDFYCFADTGLSTGINDIAAVHHDEGRQSNLIQVQTRTLSSILNDIEDNEIHWMKIDVEGMEAAVIESWYDAEARPWIIVIESTLPNSQVEGDLSWEVNLFDRGYSFVYFDGLNRFYLHDKHKNLERFFGLGPNVFDEIIIADSSSYHLTDNIVLHTGKVREECNKIIIKLKNKLSEKTMEFDKEVIRLNSHIYHVQTLLTASQEDGQKKDDTINELGMVRNKLSEQVLEFDKEVIRLNSHIHHVQTLLTASQKEAQENDRTHRNALYEVEAFKLRMELRDTEIAGHSAILSELEGEYIDMRRQIRQKTEECNKATNDRSFIVANYSNLEAEKLELERLLLSLEQEKIEVNLKVKNLNDQLLDYKTSTSWRVTAPIRYLKNISAGSPKSTGQVSRSNDISWKTKIKLKALRVVREYPFTKSIILIMVSPFPVLRNRLLDFGKQNELVNHNNNKKMHQKHNGWNLLADEEAIEFWQKSLKRKN